MPSLFAAGTAGIVAAVTLGFLFMGLAYGPIGTVLAELFPAAVRYTGSSLAYNLAGILGASLAPYAAQWLAERHGLQAVGYYLAAAAVVSLAGLVASRETKDTTL
jgi:fucose permease